MPGFLGRSDYMVKLRGINIFPTAIGAILHEIDALGGEYVCQLEIHNGREELRVLAEVLEPAQVGDTDLQKQVSDSIRQKLGVSVMVDLVGPGETAELTEVERRQKPIRLIKP